MNRNATWWLYSSIELRTGHRQSFCAVERSHRVFFTAHSDRRHLGYCMLTVIIPILPALALAVKNVADVQEIKVRSCRGLPNYPDKLLFETI